MGPEDCAAPTSNFFEINLLNNKRPHTNYNNFDVTKIREEKKYSEKKNTEIQC